MESESIIREEKVSDRNSRYSCLKVRRDRGSGDASVALAGVLLVNGAKLSGVGFLSEKGTRDRNNLFLTVLRVLKKPVD
jgi:hypothetical protein